MSGVPRVPTLDEKQVVRLVNPKLVEAFGTISIDLPSRVRERVHRTMSQPPRFQQACLLLKKDPAAALIMLDELLMHDAETQKDPRYFGVYWQRGAALENINADLNGNADWDSVIQQYAEAVVRYPDETRSNHYLKIARLLAEHTARNGSDRAAILKRGVEDLRRRGAECSAELLAAHATSEQPRTNEYRPDPIHERAMKTSRGINLQAGIGVKSGVDWIEELTSRSEARPS